MCAAWWCPLVLAGSNYIWIFKRCQNIVQSFITTYKALAKTHSKSGPSKWNLVKRTLQIIMSPAKVYQIPECYLASEVCVFYLLMFNTWYALSKFMHSHCLHVCFTYNTSLYMIIMRNKTLSHVTYLISCCWLHLCLLLPTISLTG